MKTALNNKSVAKALASLGHEARLSVFRLLVRSGHEGLNVGEISQHLDLPASTLAHHLRTLVLAGLVIQERRGRETYNRPDFDVMAATAAFLTDECCAGVGQKTDAA
ncbi:MAG: metalloregulator ArsR/SmtB family transcription factor [Albidovulum sp.]